MKTNKLLLSLLICIFFLGKPNAFALDMEIPAAEITEEPSVEVMEAVIEEPAAEIENIQNNNIPSDDLEDSTPANDEDETASAIQNDVDNTEYSDAAESEPDESENKIISNDTEETPDIAAEEDIETGNSNSAQQSEESPHISSKPFTINSKKISTAAANDDYKSLEFTFSRENESEYYGFITGIKSINESNLTTLISDIANFFYYNLDTYTPADIQKTLTISNTDDYGIDFIDAEKWTVSDETAPEGGCSDSLLCWAGTLSNMIELSGWADEIEDVNGNPIINQADNIPDEDEVFDLYRSSFYNGTANIPKGGEWFFDGVYQKQPVDVNGDPVTTQTKGSASVKNLDSGGYLKDYSVANIVTEYRTDSSTDAGDKIADMFSELNTGSVFGINQVLYNTEYKEYLNAHATTLMGYIKEMVNGIVGTGVEALKAIFIADSDNSVPIGSSCNPVQNENSITMINTVPVTVNGAEAIRYTANRNPVVNYISSVAKICACSSTEAENARETDARALKDCINNMDFCVTSMNNVTVNPTYEIGSTITVSVRMMNKSYKKADIDDIGPHVLKGSLIVYKDGIEYEKISAESTFFKINALEDMLYLYEDYTIKATGSYEIGFVLESVCDLCAQHEVKEAYYLNNKSTQQMNIKFVVKGKDEDKNDNNLVDDTSPSYFIPVYYYCFSLTSSNDTFTVNIGKLDMSGISVYYNGKPVGFEYYSISTDDSGNTNIIFNVEYLKSLGFGTHNFELYTSDRTLTATVRISSN